MNVQGPVHLVPLEGEAAWIARLKQIINGLPIEEEHELANGSVVLLVEPRAIWEAVKAIEQWIADHEPGQERHDPAKHTEKALRGMCDLADWLTIEALTAEEEQSDDPRDMEGLWMELTEPSDFGMDGAP